METDTSSYSSIPRPYRHVSQPRPSQLARVRLTYTPACGILGHNVERIKGGYPFNCTDSLRFILTQEIGRRCQLTGLIPLDAGIRKP